MLGKRYQVPALHPRVHQVGPAALPSAVSEGTLRQGTDPNFLGNIPKQLLPFSCSVVSNSMRRPGLQHARLPCPSLSSGICSNSCSLSW